MVSQWNPAGLGQIPGSGLRSRSHAPSTLSLFCQSGLLWEGTLKTTAYLRDMLWKYGPTAVLTHSTIRRVPWWLCFPARYQASAFIIGS